MSRKKHGHLLHELATSRSMRRMFCMHMGISLVVFVLLVGLAIGYTASRNDEQFQQDAQDSLQQAEAINNYYIRSLSEYMLTAMEDYEIRALLYSSDYSLYLSINSRAAYNQVASISSLIKSVQFVNFNTRTILDSNGRYSFDNYADSSLFELLDSLTPQAHSPVFFYPREMNLSASVVTPYQSRVVSLIFYLNKAGALVLNLDYDGYKEMVLGNSQNTVSSFYFVNSLGQLFCTSDEDGLISTNMLEDPVYQEILEQQASSGSFSYSRDGGSKTVLYRKGALMGASYYAVVTKNGLLGALGILQSVLILGVIYLAVSLALSMAMSFVTTLPLRILHKTVRQKRSDEPTKKAVDEVSYLDTVYNDIMLSNERLAAQSAEYQQERDSWLMLRLMTPPDTSPTPVSASEVSELEAQFAYSQFVVLAMMPDRRAVPSEASGHEVRKQAADIAGMWLKKLGDVRIVAPLSFQILFLLNVDSIERSETEPVLEAMMEECCRSLENAGIYLGVGGLVSSLDEIAASYTGAQEALQRAYMQHMNTACFADDLTFPDQAEQGYSYDIDAEIAKAIRHGQEKQAEEWLQRFFDRIASFSHNHYLRNVLQLDSAFCRLENSLQVTGSGGVDTSTLLHWDLREARQYFTRRAKLDIAQINNTRREQADNSELISRINEMIDQRIYDPSLSAAQLADEFSFSVNYLRSLYKMATGETLSAHITQCRLRAACDLLDNTDETIEDITVKLSFSSKNYFFTFFKKHMGMTPSQYRQRKQ